MLEIYIYFFFFVEKQFVIYNLSSKLIRNARSVYSSYIYFTFYTLKLKIRFLKRDIVRRVISRIAKLGEETKKEGRDCSLKDFKYCKENKKERGNYYARRTSHC